MIIDSTLEYKTVSECAPGDLVRLRDKIAIVLDPYKNRTRIGLLNPKCAVMIVPDNTHCISYGDNWILSTAVGKETYPKNGNYTEESGCIILDARGMLLVFGPSASLESEGLAFDLRKKAVVASPGYESAPILNWKIWESQANRDRGEPAMIEFSYAPAS